MKRQDSIHTRGPGEGQARGSSPFQERPFAPARARTAAPAAVPEVVQRRLSPQAEALAIRWRDTVLHEATLPYSTERMDQESALAAARHPFLDESEGDARLLQVLNAYRLPAPDPEAIFPDVVPGEQAVQQLTARHQQILATLQRQNLLALQVGQHAKVGRRDLALSLLTHPKVANEQELRQLLDHDKLVSGNELLALLNRLKVVSGADLLLLFNNAKVDTAAHLAELLDVAVVPNTGRLAAFFADAHAPTLREARRVVALGAVEDWDRHWQGRLNVNDQAAAAADFGTLTGGTLSDLQRRTRNQADWHRGLVDEGQRSPIRQILDFLRNTPGALDACGRWGVADFWNRIRDGDILEAVKLARLTAYARGVRGQESCPVASRDTVAAGLEAGRNVLRLEAALGGALLKEIFTEETFDDLAADGLDDFLGYVAACRPNLSAREGKEISAYLSLRASVDPASYQPTLGHWMVNFHRFRYTALRELVRNFANRTKNLPVTVLIHSPLDKDGAFHRDENLTDVITRGGHLTLLIEGQQNLDNISTLLDEITRDYCPGGRIANMMLIGHGQSRAIELAGTTNDRGRENDTGLDLTYGQDRGFLRGLIDRLVDHVDTRLIINACHTDSNEVERTQGLTGNELQDMQAIRNYIRDNPSLAQFARNYAVAQGQNLTVVGANAATRHGIEFLGHGGALTLRDQEDPAITGTKLEYARTGTDPKGALRAALEVWAVQDNHVPLFQAMTARAQNNSNDWREQVTRLLYRIILTHYRASAPNFARLVDAAGALKKLRYEEDCTPAKLNAAGLTGPELTFIDQGVRGTQVWGTNPFLPLLFHQAAGRTDHFLAALAAVNKNVRSLTRADRIYVAAGFDFAGALPLLGGFDKGKVLLSIIGFKQHQNDHCRAYLTSYLRGLNDNPLPWAAEFDVTKESLARDVGLLQAAGPALQNANLRVGEGAGNSLYVEPLTQRLRAAAGARAYAQPDVSSLNMEVPENTVVNVLGRLPDWYAVERGDRTVFMPLAALV